MESGAGKKVCVTGASGYIASWVVKFLLERGYTVNATVRSLKDPSKTDHLLSLDGAKERLQLFEAHLLENGSFDAAINGCDGVFHTASPAIGYSPNPQVDIVDPAVKGTLNVLVSCAKVPSVKRVVLTSSTVAVVNCGRPLTEETIVDETWFSTPEGCQGLWKWYDLSKTMAEEAAWKFATENGLDLVSMNPAFVVGPLLQPTLNGSSSLIYNLINGSETYPNFSMGFVHIKDVAEAHILAFEIPSANGRYILSETVAHLSDVVKILGELYPDLKLPDKCMDDNAFMPSYKFSKERAESLGIHYIPLKTGLTEMVESLKEKFINV